MSAKMRKLVNIINTISTFSSKLLFLLPWAIALIIFWEIILRWVFNHPTVWAHESSQMIFGALAILGGAYALRRRVHVNMDLIYSCMSRRTKAILDLITFILFLLPFCSILMWKGWGLFTYSFGLREISISDWGPPLWPIKFTIPLGAFLILLQGVGNFISDIYTAITGKGIEA